MINEDAFLMNRVAQGSEVATRTLVKQHFSYVMVIAFRLLNDKHEAEDVAQESFLKLWKQSKSWKAQAKVSTWLYTVTRNACVDRLKKNKPILNEKILEMAQSEPETSFLLDSQPRLQQLQQVLGQMSEKYRLVLTAFYYDQLKIKDAAVHFGLTEDAYESLLRRARAKLKQIIQNEKNQVV